MSEQGSSNPFQKRNSRLFASSGTTITRYALPVSLASSAHSSEENDAENDPSLGSDSDNYASTELGFQGDKETKETQQEIARQETRAVQRLRIIFALVIIVCTVLVAVSVYIYTTGTEQRAFEEAFSSDANKVLESIGKRKSFLSFYETCLS